MDDGAGTGGNRRTRTRPRPIGRPPAKRAKPSTEAYSIDQSARHLRNYYGDSTPDPRDDAFFRTTRALVVTARRWRKLANERVKRVGQSMPRWETLYLVACSDEALTQGELARVVNVEGPTMVHMLNSLARDGLIERYQSSLDRRVTHNRITPAGEQATRDIMAITNELRAEMLCDIDPEKLAVALEVLEQIQNKLDVLEG